MPSKIAAPLDTSDTGPLEGMAAAFRHCARSEATQGRATYGSCAPHWIALLRVQ